jgi:hypothetical protein
MTEVYDGEEPESSWGEIQEDEDKEEDEEEEGEELSVGVSDSKAENDEWAGCECQDGAERHRTE